MFLIVFDWFLSLPVLWSEAHIAVAAVMFRIAGGDVTQLPHCVTPALVALLKRSWAQQPQERPKMLEWLDVLDGGVRALQRECEVCLESHKLSSGALCDSTQHLQCFACVSDRLTAARVRCAWSHTS
jgi:hypothetical protein